MLASMPAFADEGDVLRPYVGLSVTHDDNILGTSNDALAATPAVSDTARRLEAGLIVDKTFSRQRVTADISLNRTNFNRFNNLDYTGRDIQAKWNWRAGNYVDGNVGITHVRALSSVQESLATPGLLTQVPSVRTQDRRFVDAAWLVHPSWRVRGGLSRYDLDYDQPALRFANRTINDGELGVDYLARSGSSVGMQLRRAKGEFPLSPTSNYDQDEIKGRVDWKYSGKTDLQFLAGWVKRQHKIAPAQDFSGFNGRANATWRATYKITVNGGLWREIGVLDERTALYSLNQAASIGMGWEMTAKTRLDTYYQHERRDYTPAGLARKDTVNYGSLMLTYFPIRDLRLRASIYRTEQDSDVPFVAYRNNGASISTRYEF